MAIQKYVEAQADVAKAQSPCDIGWLRIDITPAKRDVSLFATWINLFTSHMRGWIVATLSDLLQIHGFCQTGFESTSRWVTWRTMGWIDGRLKIRCLNYLDRRETAFKFFDIMASMCWMTLLQAGRCKMFWERLLGLGKRSWKRRLKGRKKFSRCKWPRSTLLSFWTNFTFQSGNSAGTSKPKLRLSSKAVARRSLK